MIDFHPIRGTARFYFVRHGESEGNKAGVIQGRVPSRLTEKGRDQARETGRWFRTRGVDLILTSPLTRASQTAGIIAEEAGVEEIQSLEELSEIDTGIFSGLTRAEASARYPFEWKTFNAKGWESVPGAEKIGDLSSRAHAVWSRLVELFTEGTHTILSVTHSGFLQWIIRSTFGLDSWMPLISTSGNCAITLLKVENHLQSEGGSSYYVNWVMINMPPSAASEAS
jgi:broad specificity phosphatase PhoE